MPDLPFEPTTAHQHYERVLERALKLDARAVLIPRIDVQRAVVVALKVWNATQEPEVAQRFALVAAALFDPSHLEALEELTWAMWHSNTTLLTARAGASDAKLSATLVEEASGARAELLRILDYHLDAPKDRALLASIVSGGGHVDLSSDLLRLRDLAVAHLAELQGDKRFRPELLEQCARCSEQIVLELGQKDRALERQIDLQYRIWTLLLSSYTEVAVTGSYIFRDTAMAERFPTSLISSCRRYRRRAKVAATAESERP